MQIILYTTGCPKCKALKKLLELKGIKYEESTSVDEMLSMGIAQVPMLKVDDELMNYNAANAWLNLQ